MSRWMILCGSLTTLSFLLTVSNGYSQSVMPATEPGYPPSIGGSAMGVPGARQGEWLRSRNAAEMDAVREMAVGLAEPEVSRPADPFRQLQPAEARVIEPRRGTIEELRRSFHRYPDQDLGSRFIETGTELPPLFGQDE